MQNYTGRDGLESDRIHSNGAVTFFFLWIRWSRYESNIIHTPLVAGTCHLSPLGLRDGDITGGDFRANIRGIEHYRQFGYKGTFINDQMASLSSFFGCFSSQTFWSLLAAYFLFYFMLQESWPQKKRCWEISKVKIGWQCATSKTEESCTMGPTHTWALQWPAYWQERAELSWASTASLAMRWRNAASERQSTAMHSTEPSNCTKRLLQRAYFPPLFPHHHQPLQFHHLLL